MGVYILRKTGKRQVVDLLNKLGVCASYDALQLYETIIFLDPPKQIVSNHAFVQFVFDNTDHNISTLDRKKTFHCLGGVAAYTPSNFFDFEGHSRKLTKIPNADIISSQHQIDTVPFTRFNKLVLNNFVFRCTYSMHIEKPPVISNTQSAYL